MNEKQKIMKCLILIEKSMNSLVSLLDKITNLEETRRISIKESKEYIIELLRFSRDFCKLGEMLKNITPEVSSLPDNCISDINNFVKQFVCFEKKIDLITFFTDPVNQN